MHRPTVMPSQPSLPGALTAITAHDAALHRKVVPARNLKHSPKSLSAGCQQWDVNPTGYEALCRAVGAPIQYLERLDPELRTRAISYQLSQGDHVRGLRAQGRNIDERIVVVSRNDTFVGFARADLHTPPAETVLARFQQVGEAVLGPKFGTLMVQRLSFRDEGFELDLHTPELTIEPRAGDLLHGGVRLCHSFLGSHPPRIETFIFRLVCANGAVRRECAGETSLRTRRATASAPDADHSLSRFAEICRHVFANLGAKLESTASLTEHPLRGEGEVARFIEAQLHYIPRLHSRRLVDQITTAWRRDGAELSEYAVWNAFTNVATHASPDQLSPHSRGQLERLGGVLATRSLHFCPHCFRVLGQG